MTSDPTIVVVEVAAPPARPCTRPIGSTGPCGAPSYADPQFAAEMAWAYRYSEVPEAEWPKMWRCALGCTVIDNPSAARLVAERATKPGGTPAAGPAYQAGETCETHWEEQPCARCGKRRAQRIESKRARLAAALALLEPELLAADAADSDLAEPIPEA